MANEPHDKQEPCSWPVGDCQCARSATAPIADEFNTFWAFRFKDGSYWTDDIFDRRERAERWLQSPDGEFAEGAELIEVVFIPKSAVTEIGETNGLRHPDGHIDQPARAGEQGKSTPEETLAAIEGDNYEAWSKADLISTLKVIKRGRDRLRAELLARAEERRSGWIPVSERLPEPEIDVLVRGTNGFISIDSVESFEVFDVAVTHWMPLPDGPHGE